MSLQTGLCGAFAAVARKRADQLVQSPEVSWSKWPALLQSRCGSLPESLASLCLTQVRKIIWPFMRLVEAPELAGRGESPATGCGPSGVSSWTLVKTLYGS